MKIEKIEVIRYHLPLRKPISVSFGKVTYREGLLVTLYGGGLLGWGECPIIDGYGAETIHGAWYIACDRIMPQLLGAEITEPDQMQAQMAHVRGNHFAKSMFDMALWDLTAKRDGLSFAEKLCQPYSEGAKRRVKTGISIGIQPTVENLITVIEDYLDQGYGRIKLKIKPGHDLEPVARVRSTFPDIPLMVDANSAYQLRDLKTLQQMDQYDLTMIEQPLADDDIFEHSQLKALVRTPICLDESIHTLSDIKTAEAIGAIDILNIKPPRVGGWSRTRKIHDFCQDVNIPIWIGGMVETELGTAAKVAAAALPGVNLHSDIAVSGERFSIKIAEPILLNSEDSTVNVPTNPGLGIEIDQKAIEKITVQKEVFNL